MKRICVVCFANYCRSPVAENILSNLHDSSYKFTSAGLEPIPKASMDPRSFKYLKSIDIQPDMHNPKLITKKVFDESDLILAMDQFILIELNRKFKLTQKIKLLTHQNPKLIIPDPYKFSEPEYFEVMTDIHNVCKSIKF